MWEKLLRHCLFVSILPIFLNKIVIAQDDFQNTPQKTSNNGKNIIEVDETNAPLNLNWLINEALEHNPEIIAAQRQLRAANERIPQAKSLDDPMIRAGSFEMSDSPLDFNNDAGMLEHRCGISQKIPFLGKLRLRGEVAEEESNMAEEELQSKMQEIIALVKMAFYEFHYIDRAIDITEENRELLRKFAKIAETKYKVGRTTQRDVLAAQVEVSTLTNNLIVLNEQRESITDFQPMVEYRQIDGRPDTWGIGNFYKHTIGG